MTNEEMERGIEFLLNHQAGFEARLAQIEAREAQTQTQLAQTSKQVEMLAQMQAEFTKFVRSNLEAQSELNTSLRETVRALTVAQARTDERLGQLENDNGQG
jgi:predicted  nucleic acid-binding Zn-ribbon protein